jgi:cation-transporting ATPase 13A3/4/5
MKSMTKFDFPVSVLRDGSWSNVVSTEIVPGDIVKLDDSVQLIPCDGYLLFGDLIVDESMLTGESIPITKKATFRGHSGSVVQAEGKTGPIDPGNLFGLLENQKARNFLFSGTRIVQSKNLRRRQPVCMIASKTGFNTVKGRLIRAIIFPPPNRFKFYLDSFKFVGVLSVLALCGFVYTAWNFTRLHARISEILFHGFDLVTAVVPPALPATMTIGINFAVSRLRKKKIICVSPQRVNMCGKISVVCFDKTGTLTEDSLGIHGIVISDPDGSLKDFSCIEEAASSSSPHALLMEYLLACCHSLRQIQAAVLGDPLEVEMFNFSKWVS